MKKCDVALKCGERASHPIVRCSLPQFHTGPHHGSVSWTTHDVDGAIKILGRVVQRMGERAAEHVASLSEKERDILRRRGVVK